MSPSSTRIQIIYLILTLLNTLASSFIWGINTLFLLDAGLNNTQAFTANAFFTVGQVLFEVPTGLVADIKGRRISYLLGTVTLALSTLMYVGAWYIEAGFIFWAISSVVLGLGFTFFSGATEAWLVDSLKFANYEGGLDAVFAKGQIVSGIAMLSGSVAGGYIAQATNLSIPYFFRAGFLILNFLVALLFMKDWGFESSENQNLLKKVKSQFMTSIDFGWKNLSVRWVMLAGLFSSGVGFYTFYAMQPYLLELWGDSEAYGIAGLAAAIVAGAQILGGVLVPYIRKLFQKRTSILIVTVVVNVAMLLLAGLTSSFWIAIGLLSIWGIMFAVVMPVRQAYLNGLIPSEKRATVLSFDNMLGSGGGVAIQPALGRAADVWSYSVSFMIGAGIQAAALPFILMARKEKPESDEIK